MPFDQPVSRRTVLALAPFAALSMLCGCTSGEAVEKQAEPSAETATVRDLNPKDAGDKPSTGTKLSGDFAALDSGRQGDYGSAVAQAARDAVPFGQTMALTNGPDAGAASGTVRHGEWTGTMEVRVVDAAVYESHQAAQEACDLGVVSSFGAPDETIPGVHDLRFLVVEVDVANVDAVGSMAGGEGVYALYAAGLADPPAADELFLAGTFSIVSPDLATTAYSQFSFAGGYQADGLSPSAKIAHCYQLAPGESARLRLGWYVSSADPSQLYLTADIYSATRFPEVLFDLGLGDDEKR